MKKCLSVFLLLCILLTGCSEIGTLDQDSSVESISESEESSVVESEETEIDSELESESESESAPESEPAKESESESESSESEVVESETSDEDSASPVTEKETVSTEEKETASTSTEKKETQTTKKEEKSSSDKAIASLFTAPEFTVSDAPEYSGKAYISVHDGEPFFSTDDITEESFEKYSSLDKLGRCGVALACVSQETAPADNEERESISSITPSGWKQAEYDFVDGGYLYNRCHLIGWQLSAENANERNLITGTRTMNVSGMLPFENMIADYIKEEEGHVLYRVTPIYKGKNLVASGVLLEAMSVEDEGDEILFCVYVYNVEPGVTIDYSDGSSISEKKETEKKSEKETTSESKKKKSDTSEAKDSSTKEDESENDKSAEFTYVLNTNTGKFHYKDCSSAKQIKEENKDVVTCSRSSLIEKGYEACKRCNP